jgi:hypothetical protein
MLISTSFIKLGLLSNLFSSASKFVCRFFFFVCLSLVGIDGCPAGTLISFSYGFTLHANMEVTTQDIHQIPNINY